MLLGRPFSEANAEFINVSAVGIFSLKTEGAWRDLIYHNGTHNPAGSGCATALTSSSRHSVATCARRPQAPATRAPSPNGHPQSTGLKTHAL